MQNFNDLLDGYTDGTKDLSISALTVAGAATFNGNVTLGNASGDTITFTGSVASDVLPSAADTHSIGSAALGFANLYLGDNANSVGLTAHPSASADWTFTFPAATGSTSQLLRETDGAGTMGWTGVTIDASDNLANVGTIGCGAITSTGDLTVDTNALFVDISENEVGINVTSTLAALHVVGPDGDAAGAPAISADTVALFQNNSATTSDRCHITILAGTAGASSIYFADSGDENAGRVEYEHNNNALVLYANASERVRVDSSGNVGINQSPSHKLHISDDQPTSIRIDTSVDGSTLEQGVFRIENSDSSLSGSTRMVVLDYANISHSTAQIFMVFSGSSGAKGNITSTAATTLAYATSSDARLKTDVKVIPDALKTVSTLRPCNFKWLTDGSRSDGFLAQELYEAYPQPVVPGRGDNVKEDPWSVDYAKVTPLLTKAIQELLARVEKLEAAG
jgi:hypothetical protein